jgi:hypothetical protein
MKLVAELEALIEREESPFRAQLLREEVARLRKLDALKASSPDLAGFVAAGMRIGWTPGEARTHELVDALKPFLQAVHGNDEAATVERWNALYRLRMERLLGCLSTPVPRPAD